MKCPKCNAEQKGAVDACSVCGAYLLARKTASDRVIGLVVGLVLLAGIFLVSLLIQQTWSFWAAIFILGGPAAKAFSVAFGKFTPAAAYAKRAREYVQSDPEQAIADITKAIELAGKKRGAYYLQRANIYEQAGQPEATLHDLQRIRELSRGERGGIQVAAVEKEIQRLTQKSPEVAAAAEAAKIVVLPYVGFIRRAVALLIDGIILTPIIAILQALLAPEAAVYIWFVVVGAYFLGFWVWRGQTPGKMALGIRITHDDKLSLSFGRALLRLLLYPISIGLTVITWIIIEAHGQKRALHDSVAGTYVIKTSAKQPEEMKQ